MWLNDNMLMLFIFRPSVRLSIVRDVEPSKLIKEWFALPDIGEAFISGVKIALEKNGCLEYPRMMSNEEDLNILASELRLLLIAELMEEAE